MYAPLDHVYDDGGRAAAGFKAATGDCVVRAIAIATGLPYAKVYGDLRSLMTGRTAGHRTPRRGVPRSIWQPYLESLGWKWEATMSIGSGTRVHLRKGDLPSGPVIARVTHHLVAVHGDRLFDTHDCSRSGTRAVYGYMSPGSNAVVQG